ncbi:zinc ribbon domain-containing protein [Thalassoroseus pseudoceratinae]|uniref:zinc ribbon domain-containing protein n=1 Tax=Thalassoroseus pseudoceratinae TaxID=2713176 RepID=UPI00141E3BA1|nr:zinc ribbon domain-containing protein [Thalassoroseus pseudoceratinae]
MAAVRLSRCRQDSSDATTQDGKQIRPIAPGTSLVYPLSGLARCGECQASMRVVATGRKSKEGKSYVYYACPIGTTDGGCPNKKYIPEAWLWEIVVNQITSRLFPTDG